jgi:formimidoylglutamate deiminase
MGGALSGCLFARHALLPQGWRRDVLLEWDAAGDLTAVTDNAVAPEKIMEKIKKKTI